MSSLFKRPLAIVDLETTGADPHRDRITEIAILRVEDGVLVEAWSSLVDPEMPIPLRIQEFTGITDAMVSGAPNFRALADDVARRLEGAVFVAHNARFDFNFLKAAFLARGLPFDPPVMCSVKFSRALNPEHARHGLDAIIARQGYVVTDRHRAMTDAELVWRFLQDSLGVHDDARIVEAMKRAGSTAAAVPYLPEGDLEALPEAPGVFVFLNGADGVLQMGHTQHLRSKVLGSFTSTKDVRAARIAAQTRRVETVPAAGELDAQLIEQRLSRRYQPEKHPQTVLAWRLIANRRKPPVLELAELHGTDPADWSDVFGLFRGPREAENALRELALLHRLCPQRLGLERSSGACQAYGLRRCDGVCVDRESPEAHDARLARALAPLRIKPWPWSGPVAISEHVDATGHSALHVFDRWCWQGSAHEDSAAHELLQSPAARSFDLEYCRLFMRWLSQPGHVGAVRPLHATTNAAES